MLGSGFVTSFLVMFIQLLTPFLILLYAVRETNRFPYFLNSNTTLNFENGNVGGWNDGNIPLAQGAGSGENGTNVVHSYDLAMVFWTDWNVFCQSYVA